MLKVSGQLHVSLTNVYDGKNILVSNFASKEEVINVGNPPQTFTNIHLNIKVILASCFIPVFSGILPPRYRGSRVIGERNNENQKAYL